MDTLPATPLPADLPDVGAALVRARTVLERRPAAGVHDDAPATASWRAGTRVVARHANGTQIESDMPGELGGTGDRVTPGWLFRAGLAACATTSIAMHAALQGVALALLEVHVSSRSDTRGLLGMHEADGARVYAGPTDLQMAVRIAAPGVEPERLRTLVSESCGCAPISNAANNPSRVQLQIEVEPA